MSIHLHFDPVLPRLLQRLTVTADVIRGDLFEPRDAMPNLPALPDPFGAGTADLVRPQAPVILPAAALGVSPAGNASAFAWIGSYALRWSQLTQRCDWAEHGVWIVPVTRSEGRLLAPFNATADSLAGRWARTDLLARRGWQSLLTLHVPYRGALPADCVIAANAHPDHPPLVAADGMAPPVLEGLAAALAAGQLQVALLAPATVAAGDSAVIPLQVRRNGLPLPAACEVWLEASAGYLPRRRIAVGNGDASFTFSALGLAAGDQVHLKAGWKFWPGAAEAGIAIV